MEQITRVCNVCCEEIPYEKLVKDQRKKDGVIALCQKCAYERNKASGAEQKSKDKLRQKYHEDPEFHQQMKDRMAKYRLEHNERILLSQAKIRAKKNKLEFDLIEEDIIIPERCPLMDIPLFRGDNYAKDNSPCIDRIDNTKGYVKSNIRVVSYLANRMKSNATKEQLLYFADHIKDYLGDDIV